MLQVIEKVDVADLDDANRLFLDYVSSRSAGVPTLLRPLRSVGDVGLSAPPTPLRDLDGEEDALWRGLIAEVAGLSKRLGANHRMLEKLERAKNRGARFVITGQQPGALGGPLYAIYKIATAVALAAAAEEAAGETCIPLYWCGGDDTDFQEIREVNIITRKLSVISTSISQDAHDGGMPIGDIDSESVRRIWNNIAGFVSEFPTGGEVRRIMEDAFSRANDHGELSSAILLGLLGGRFAVVDGRSPTIRRYAKPIFVDYVRREDDIKREVEENGIRLEKAGYHVQLRVGRDSGVFLLERGRRKSVAPDQREMLIDAVENNVEACSPGVVLRNLVQDYTFEPSAVVLGPAEIAYRAQIASLYDQFDVTRPLDVPRMAATFLPSGVAEVLTIAGGPSVSQLIKDPSAFARMVYETQTPKKLRDGVEEFDATVHRALDRLSGEVDEALTDRSRRKVQGRLREFRRRIEQTTETVLETGRMRALERWPFFADLPRLMRPADRPQERWLSAVVPFLHAGDRAGDSLVGIAEDYVRELMDGRVLHVVYSGEP